MIVVADTTPLNYLILIHQIEILPVLYGRVLIPQAVSAELQQPRTPAPVRAWIAQPPAWLEIRRTQQLVDSQLEALDLGEQQALALAEEVQADVVILDDKEARQEAARRRFRVIGTLGLLEEAAKLGLLDFSATLTQLQQTTFRASAELIEWYLARDADRKKRGPSET